MRILNSMIIGMFTLLSATAQAKMEGKMITCPSIDMIRQAAPVMKDNNTDIHRDPFFNNLYLVQSSPVYINGSFWFIMSHNIDANNKDEAAEVAQKRCANISHMVYQNARKGPLRDDEYACLYYDQTSSNPFVSVFAIKSYYN